MDTRPCQRACNEAQHYVGGSMWRGRLLTSGPAGNSEKGGAGVLSPLGNPCDLTCSSWRTMEATLDLNLLLATSGSGSLE